MEGITKLSVVGGGLLPIAPKSSLWKSSKATLFHNGKGDPTAPQGKRIQSLTWKQNINHLMRWSNLKQKIYLKNGKSV